MSVRVVEAPPECDDGTNAQLMFVDRLPHLLLRPIEFRVLLVWTKEVLSGWVWLLLRINGALLQHADWSGKCVRAKLRDLRQASVMTRFPFQDETFSGSGRVRTDQCAGGRSDVG